MSLLLRRQGFCRAVEVGGCGCRCSPSSPKAPSSAAGGGGGGKIAPSSGDDGAGGTAVAGSTENLQHRGRGELRASASKGDFV